MNKIAIITLHNVCNYGSVLQAYATQCYFEFLGLEPIIIDFRRPWETKFGYWFYLNEKSILGLLRNIIYFPSKVLYMGAFNRFRKKYLHLTEKTYSSESELKNYPVDADYYCTGSDQVWNSGWNKGVIKEYFLSFVDSNERKKISFASSFGNSEIPKDELFIIKPLLNDYSLITLREKQSVEMVKKEMGFEAYEILDPTLQMNGDFWMKLCHPEKLIDGKYILLIQLNRNKAFDDLALHFSRKKDIKLIRLCLRVDQIILSGEHILIPEVEDYIRLIRDAEYILTDSFHAISFCINLKKQFYVFYPEKYSERLKSILSIFHLLDRELCYNVTNKTIEYESIDLILDEKRKFARRKFKEVLLNE